MRFYESKSHKYNKRFIHHIETYLPLLQMPTTYIQNRAKKQKTTKTLLKSWKRPKWYPGPRGRFAALSQFSHAVKNKEKPLGPGYPSDHLNHNWIAQSWEPKLAAFPTTLSRLFSRSEPTKKKTKSKKRKKNIKASQTAGILVSCGCKRIFRWPEIEK